MSKAVRIAIENGIARIDLDDGKASRARFGSA
jgi:hypothetical protein